MNPKTLLEHSSEQMVANQINYIKFKIKKYLLKL